jgi:hypothetical protein
MVKDSFSPMDEILVVIVYYNVQNMFIQFRKEGS